MTLKQTYRMSVSQGLRPPLRASEGSIIHLFSTPQICHPFLAPSRQRWTQLVNGAINETEFQRVYWQELETVRPYCELLRIRAIHAGLWVACGKSQYERITARAFVRFIERLECERRWRLGWIVGGYTYPLQAEIRRHGGLWFERHKAWVFSNYDGWRSIQSLLPCDF